MTRARPLFKPSLVELVHAMNQMAQKFRNVLSRLGTYHRPTINSESRLGKRSCRKKTSRTTTNRSPHHHSNFSRGGGHCRTLHPMSFKRCGQQLGWSFGALWNVDDHSHRLRCVETWKRSSSALKEFEEKTKEMNFAKGIGLPGRVWESGSPAWIKEVTMDDNFSAFGHRHQRRTRRGLRFSNPSRRQRSGRHGVL